MAIPYRLNFSDIAQYEVTYGNAFDLHVSTRLAVVNVYVCLQQQDEC